MEKKKMKIWKKILIVIAVIILIYLLITLYKYIVLTKIYERNMESKKITNSYYYSETEDTIMEFWYKDGLMKVHLERKGNVGDIIMWEDSNTGEKYVFWNEPEKKYQEGGQVVANYASMFTESQSKIRLMMAAHPLLFIVPTKYDNKQCYYVTMFDIKEKIDKETGLTLLEGNSGIERTLKYTFDDVTDEDVEMPNLSEYEYTST